MVVWGFKMILQISGVIEDIANHHRANSELKSFSSVLKSSLTAQQASRKECSCLTTIIHTVQDSDTLTCHALLDLVLIQVHS
jgi:hypothetical protein